MELHSLVSSLGYLVSNGRQILLGDIRLGGSATGLQQELGGSLRASRYIDKNTGVVDGSLHIYTLLFSFRIYIAILVCALLS